MTLERDFAAWNDRRDAEALGRVFDATAGRLLLLAEHLAGGSRGGGGAAAEDLVQETFLLAMDRSATWDRRRPVWPWLAAILHHRAHHHLRQRRRRREVGEGAIDAVVSDAPTPEQLNASEDAVAAIVAAIDGLPLPYRQVLRLRLVHGLRAIEIARALEQPVGTVRAQISRGRALLKERLPSVVGAVLAVRLPGSEPGLDAVRAAVMEHARAAAGASAAAASASALSVGVGSLVAMKTKWMIGGLAAALLLLAYTLVPSAEAPTGQPGPEDPAMARGPLPQVGSAEDRGAADAVARIEDLDPASPAPGLIVTVTDGKEGVVPDAEVEVAWGPRGVVVRETQFLDLATGRTDGRGEYRCSLDELSALSGLVRRTSFLEVVARAGGIESTQYLDLPDPREDPIVRADVELGVGNRPRLSGRVVDGEGRPVRGASVWGAWDGQRSRHFASADHKGRFEFSQPDEVSEFVVGHATHGFATRELPATSGEVAGVVDLGEIVLPGADARRCVTGRVTLGDGLPLAEVEVVVVPCPDGPAADGAEGKAEVDPASVVRRVVRGDQAPAEFEQRGGRVVRNTGEVRTGVDGTFRVAGLEPGARYAAYVRDSAMRHHAVVAVAGGAGVELVIEDQELRIEVQDLQGAPLPGARLLCEVFADRDGVEQQIGSIWPELLSDGGQRLLVPFDVILRVRPFDDFVRTAVLEHHVHAGVARAFARLQLDEAGPTGALRIVVVDDRGEPCPEFHFELRALDRVASHMGFGPEALVESLSPGRWAAKVLMGMSGPGTHDVAARGVHEEEVLVVGGRTTELRVVAPATGSVVFRPRSSAGGALTGLQCTGVDGQPLKLRTRRFHGFVELETVESGGGVIVEEAFPPGRRTFTVTADGHEPATFTVDIEVDAWALASPVLRATGGNSR